MEVQLPGGLRLSVVQGSVLEQQVAAIVNAANTRMRGGGGLDGAIHAAAGPELLRELVEVAPHGARTGEVVVTGAHRMPFQAILHVAGPVWSGDRSDECDALLRACYLNSLAAAAAQGLQSLGFASISTGVYGFPIDRAAPLALGAVKEFDAVNPGSNPAAVVFALFSTREYEAFQTAFLALQDELNTGGGQPGSL